MFAYRYQSVMQEYVQKFMFEKDSKGEMRNLLLMEENWRGGDI